jgi:protein-tyrosine kinase
MGVIKNNVFPAPAPNSVGREGMAMGAVLVNAGRLQIEDVERILQVQREKNLRFGEAACELKLLSKADIDYALARQFDFPYVQRGQSRLSEELVAAYEPFTAQAEALRSLRSQLLLRWFDSAPTLKALAVVSGERKEGRSFITANLAVVFAQLGQRTLLIDADLQNPRQHELFGIENTTGLSAMLSGRAGMEDIQAIGPLRNLSVLPAGIRPPNSQELLARPYFLHLLQHLAVHYDVMLLDTPAAGSTADAQIVAVRAGAVLIVARKNTARKWRVQGVSDTVAMHKAVLVGAVLNSY